MSAAFDVGEAAGGGSGGRPSFGLTEGLTGAADRSAEDKTVKFGNRGGRTLYLELGSRRPPLRRAERSAAGGGTVCGGRGRG